MHRLAGAPPLVLDYIPGGVDPANGTDNIVFDIDGKAPARAAGATPPVRLMRRR